QGRRGGRGDRQRVPAAGHHHGGEPVAGRAGRARGAAGRVRRTPREGLRPVGALPAILDLWLPLCPFHTALRQPYLQDRLSAYGPPAASSSASASCNAPNSPDGAAISISRPPGF